MYVCMYVCMYELAMHGHVGLLTDINGSVTDEFPIKDNLLILPI